MFTDIGVNLQNMRQLQFFLTTHRKRQYPKSRIFAILGEKLCYFSLLCVLCALQHYPEERHGGPERHSRDSWGGYGSDRRISEGRGIPPQTRWVPGKSENSLGALNTSSVNLWRVTAVSSLTSVNPLSRSLSIWRSRELPPVAPSWIERVKLWAALSSLQL